MHKMVTIRYKALRTGGFSVYLDIYSKGKRERKFLGLKTSRDYAKEERINASDKVSVEKAIQMANEYGDNSISLHKKKRKESHTLISYLAINRNRLTCQNIIVEALIKELTLFGANETIVYEVTASFAEAFGENLKKHVVELKYVQILNTFSLALDLAIEDGILQINPIRSILPPEEPSKKQIIPESDIEKLEKHPFSFPNCSSNLLYFIIHSGLSHNQISKMTWEQISVENLSGKQFYSVRFDIDKKDTKRFIIPEKAVVILNNLSHGNISSCSGIVFPKIESQKTLAQKMLLWGIIAGTEQKIRFETVRQTFTNKNTSHDSSAI